MQIVAGSVTAPNVMNAVGVSETEPQFRSPTNNEDGDGLEAATVTIPSPLDGESVMFEPAMIWFTPLPLDVPVVTGGTVGGFKTDI